MERSLTEVDVLVVGGGLAGLSAAVCAAAAGCRTLLLESGQRAARLPLAATLLPASSPTMLREASRGVRIIRSRVREGLHHAWGNRWSPPPPESWVDFGFVSRRELWDPLLSELRADFWDHDSIERKLRWLETQSDPHLHPYFFQGLTILTLEWLARLASGAQ